MLRQFQYYRGGIWGPSWTRLLYEAAINTVWVTTQSETYPDLVGLRNALQIGVMAFQMRVCVAVDDQHDGH